MADVSFAIKTRSAWEGIAEPGRLGRQEGAPGLTVELIDAIGLASLIALEGQGGKLAVAVRAAYGVDLPAVSRFEAGKKIGFIGTGPGQWIAVSQTLTHDVLAEDLAEKLAGLAAVSDQSDGRAVLRLSGPRARDVLAKGIPIDFDPAVFQPGHAAATLAGHIGVQIWQVDGQPTYELAVFRSMAESFWHWLAASAAEFGCEVLVTGRG